MKAASRSLPAGLLVLVVVVVIPLAVASDATAGPRLTEPRTDRLEAVECLGDLAGSPRSPVLLIPGTAFTPEEAWSWGYERVLLERGHSVCRVRLPEFGFVDLQRSVESVVTAIRHVGRRSGRRISVVGHSQGAFQAIFALRVWPRAARHVDDVVGLAGYYDGGTEWARKEVDPSTRTLESRAYCSQHCVPSTIQEASGSNLLGALGGRPLPAGVSFTAIGTLYDEVITPQPQANALPPGPATYAVQIQDVCPGRRYPGLGGGLPVNHSGMLIDAVAHALVLDALDHPGAAARERIAPVVCLRTGYDGFDPARGAPAVTAAASRSAEPEQEVRREPPLRCNLDPRCRDRRSWATPLITSARLAPSAIRTAGRCPGGGWRLRVTLQGRARGPGWLMVRVRRPGSGQDVAPAIRKRLRRGALDRSIRILLGNCGNRGNGPCCRTRHAGAYRLALETKPIHGGYWTRERSLRLRVHTTPEWGPTRQCCTASKARKPAWREAGLRVAGAASPLAWARPAARA